MPTIQTELELLNKLKTNKITKKNLINKMAKSFKYNK